MHHPSASGRAARSIRYGLWTWPSATMVRDQCAGERWAAISAAQGSFSLELTHIGELDVWGRWPPERRNRSGFARSRSRHSTERRARRYGQVHLPGRSWAEPGRDGRDDGSSPVSWVVPTEKVGQRAQARASFLVGQAERELEFVGEVLDRTRGGEDRPKTEFLCSADVLGDDEHTMQARGLWREGWSCPVGGSCCGG